MPARSETTTVIAVATSVAVIDQLTKFLLVSTFGPGRSASGVEIVDGWLALEYTENRGAAFGLLSGLAPVLAAVSIAIVAGLFLLYMRQTEPPLWQTVAISAIAGGALGNLVDRVRLGHVVDYISIGPWPNFNVADSAITVGLLILVWGLTRPASGFGMARSIDPGS